MLKLKQEIPWGKGNKTIKVADHKVAFKGNDQGKPLGELKEKELEALAIIGLESNDPSILDLFEGELPTLQELKKGKVASSTAAVKTPENNKPQINEPK